MNKIFEACVEGFAIDLKGVHGITHWMRVKDIGLRIATMNGAQPVIVELFAYLHDCKRLDDEDDPQHGMRSALWITRLRDGTNPVGDILRKLDSQSFAWLLDAVAFHSEGRVGGNITVQTCWDADRLDLWRVGVTPSPRLLCTYHGKLILETQLEALNKEVEHG